MLKNKLSLHKKKTILRNVAYSNFGTPLRIDYVIYVHV